MLKVLEAVVALVMGRILIGRVTGDDLVSWAWPLLDWRWALAIPAAALLAVMVELVVNPDFLE